MPAPTNRSILITGGTSGIGRAAAVGFAAAGWRVATCGRRADKLAEIGTIPGVGEHVEVDGWRFEIVDLDGRRIDKVLVSQIDNTG